MSDAFTLGRAAVGRARAREFAATRGSDDVDDRVAKTTDRTLPAARRNARHATSVRGAATRYAVSARTVVPRRESRIRVPRMPVIVLGTSSSSSEFSLFGDRVGRVVCARARYRDDIALL